jgi:hypothetical protein
MERILSIRECRRAIDRPVRPPEFIEVGDEGERGEMGSGETTGGDTVGDGVWSCNMYSESSPRDMAELGDSGVSGEECDCSDELVSKRGRAVEGSGESFRSSAGRFSLLPNTLPRFPAVFSNPRLIELLRFPGLFLELDDDGCGGVPSFGGLRLLWALGDRDFGLVLVVLDGLRPEPICEEPALASDAHPSSSSPSPATERVTWSLSDCNCSSGRVSDTFLLMAPSTFSKTLWS